MRPADLARRRRRHRSAAAYGALMHASALVLVGLTLWSAQVLTTIGEPIGLLPLVEVWQERVPSAPLALFDAFAIVVGLFAMLTLALLVDGIRSGADRAATAVVLTASLLLAGALGWILLEMHGWHRDLVASATLGEEWQRGYAMTAQVVGMADGGCDPRPCVRIRLDDGTLHTASIPDAIARMAPTVVVVASERGHFSGELRWSVQRALEPPDTQAFAP